MHKRIGIFLVGMFWVFSTIVPGFPEVDYKKFSFRISGIYGNIQIGDFNTIMKDTELYYGLLLGPHGFNKDKDIEVIESVWGAKAEFMMRFSKHFGLGIETGYIQKVLKPSVSWQSAEFGIFTLKTESHIHFVPLILKGYGFLPLNSRMDVYVTGGPGIYFVNNHYEYEENSQITGEEHVYYTSIFSEGTGFGFEGGIGVEIKLSSSTSFYVEGGGRSVNINKLTGRMREMGFWGGSSGDVWYFEYFDNNISDYISGIRYGDRPEADELRNIRRLNVDLSGYYLGAGLRIQMGFW